MPRWRQSDATRHMPVNDVLGRLGRGDIASRVVLDFQGGASLY